MALVKTGALITGLSGKVGGQTFGIGPSGSYLKNTGSYVNKATAKRKEKNMLLYSVTAHWRSLSSSNKTSWNTLAATYPYTNRIGNTAYYSGFNLFTKFNMNRVLVGSSIIETAPSLSTMAVPTSATLSLVSEQFTVTSSGGDDDVIVKVFASAPLSKGNTQYQKTKRIIATDSNLTVRAGVNYLGDYADVFGAFPTGMQYFVHLEFFDPSSGQPLGTFLTASQTN